LIGKGFPKSLQIGILGSKKSRFFYAPPLAFLEFISYIFDNFLNVEKNQIKSVLKSEKIRFHKGRVTE